MDNYCLMGNPVEHSKSPWIQNRFAELSGEPVHYDKRLVPLDGFAAALQAFRDQGGKGCNVTVPFKLQAAALATEASPRVALAGACNTLRLDGDQILADNTDGVGLINDITRNAGVALAGRDVLLIGAGGAGAGVLGPLLEQRPRRVVLANRTASRAQEVAARHAALAAQQGVELLACGLQDAAVTEAGFDLVINASSSSLKGAGVPVPASVLRPGALACDLMYGPAAQGFMDWAAAHGAVPRDGLGMLVEQAAEAFRIWRGVRPPSAAVLAELREKLAAA
ncbi:shikimate dehydrogenase [Ramlibacter sp. 2FC]|uniref:shikimate dehydrogenase n=1 Tax=Ramlibacter sp. 2FC TaxID=2502188 RepID=UPI0010F71E32|nr:shikimate dehydrogenase [Ramlibacter sp. 2FC]